MKTGILNCQQHSTVVSAATTDDTLDTDQCLLIGYDEKILTPEERREGEEGRGGEGVTERERESMDYLFPIISQCQCFQSFLKSHRCQLNSKFNCVQTNSSKTK